VAAQASPIFNDGFNGISDPMFITVNLGGMIDPWTVSSGSVDWIGGYWQPAGGNGSIDIAGNGPGALSTTLSTVVGQSYTLSFYLAGNPDGGDPNKFLQVQVGNLNQIFTFNTSGHSHTSMGWTLESVSFTATATNNTLTFSSPTVGSPYGAALDEVTVSPVPEPATYAFALLGLASIGLFLRRR
jgi:choice-of-anchor C domain-containing protein